MRARHGLIVGLAILSLLFSPLLLGEDGYSAAPAAQTSTTTAPDPLLQLLVSKGVLNAAEARSLTGTPAEQRARLLDLLRQKGVLSATDYDSLTTPSASAQVAPNLIASTSPILPAAVANPAPEPKPAKPAGPTFIPAIAPVRVLAVDPPKREGLIPAFKIGNVRVLPYGFYKTSAVYDSSSPRGDDFPLPGFLSPDTGPDGNPEFHVKARALRVGSNFEWLDPSSRLTLTGRLEFDFEGNFSRVDNRNISSIARPAPSFRLGWARLDYASSDKDTVFALFGEDWTPFGSSVLPNSIETTGLGIAFGSIYERSPQIRGGFVHNFGGSRTFKLSPEIAVVMPSFGNLPSDLGNQLGYGERQGADSARPEVQARVVAQFQLDPAPGVAPAQLIVSGVQSRRAATVLKSAIPLCVVDEVNCIMGTEFQEAFPRGYRASSERYGVIRRSRNCRPAMSRLPQTSTAEPTCASSSRGNCSRTLMTLPGRPHRRSLSRVDGSSAVVFGFDASGKAVAAPSAQSWVRRVCASRASLFPAHPCQSGRKERRDGA